ncbi:MAG: malonic semialdehyde reductase [Alphaproteobacteria bacterium]
MPQLPIEGQKLLFSEARTHHSWQDKAVDEKILRQIYDLMKWAPTSLNAQPIHIVFVVSQEAKQRLLPVLMAGNVEHTRAAAATAIIAYDIKFYEHFPKTFPAVPNMKDNFANNAKSAESLAFRNGSLQGGYFILAARALGLDTCGMSGFNNDKLDKEFFADGRYKSNFLCNLGYGDNKKLYPRGYRHPFDEACKII